MMREYIPKEKEHASGFMKALHRAVGSLIDGLDLLVTHAQLLLRLIAWGERRGHFIARGEARAMAGFGLLRILRVCIRTIEPATS